MTTRAVLTLPWLCALLVACGGVTRGPVVDMAGGRLMAVATQGQYTAKYNATTCDGSPSGYIKLESDAGRVITFTGIGTQTVELEPGTWSAIDGAVLIGYPDQPCNGPLTLTLQATGAS